MGSGGCLFRSFVLGFSSSGELSWSSSLWCFLSSALSFGGLDGLLNFFLRFFFFFLLQLVCFSGSIFIYLSYLPPNLFSFPIVSFLLSPYLFWIDIYSLSVPSLTLLSLWKHLHICIFISTQSPAYRYHYWQTLILSSLVVMYIV